MKMINIILSFFILVIFSNVKAATFQDANNNNPQPIAYASVAHPNIKLYKFEKEYREYLDTIDYILNYESENTNYAYQGDNYHWVITDFDMLINNNTRNFYDIFISNKARVIINSTIHFISYIKESIKCLVTQHMKKYDFENNYDDNLKKLANDLKGLIYDKFDNDSKGLIYDKLMTDLKGLIYDKFGNDLRGLVHENPRNHFKCILVYLLKCFKRKTSNEESPDKEKEKFRNKTKEFFKVLLDNSNIMIRGYFIKIRKDGNYTDLCQNESLYFKISIGRDDTTATHDLKVPTPNVAKLMAQISRKS
ncbi:fam-d protein [Plasmodium chabaudi chabaudi]|uniref:Fam-d protein n=1 Tax=Plasmodium chabaudi chabaudi TaxID=31271 RepID=A0A4V0K846_PLACU|nr:fam-d protein [Plasmodium chabaudi chabaudi]VTZ68873.1 fam-d protein [Plasmodium chabaudi chabaudi]|eukprot:XP_742644.2 fam-d protein [Plasmodium chabaudi chabaudi]